MAMPASRQASAGATANSRRQPSLRAKTGTGPLHSMPLGEITNLTENGNSSNLSGKIGERQQRKPLGAYNAPLLPAAFGKSGAAGFPSKRLPAAANNTNGPLFSTRSTSNTTNEALPGMRGYSDFARTTTAPTAAGSTFDIYDDVSAAEPAIASLQEVTVPEDCRDVPPQDQVAVASAEAAVSEDPQKVSEYSRDIFAKMKSMECRSGLSPAYMEKQTDVNAKMRAILVDWLVEVHMKYKMRRETLFLTVSITDRYLSVRVVPRRKLQLVGVSALFIAAKFEEIHPPEVKELAYITDNAYTTPAIMNMEVGILNALNFSVCDPTAIHFFDEYVDVNQCDDLQKDLVQYLTELALVEISMLAYAPSQVVASACFLSNKMLQRSVDWSTEMEAATGWTDQALVQCAKDLCALLDNAAATGGNPHRLQAVYKKFSTKIYSEVALLKVV